MCRSEELLYACPRATLQKACKQLKDDFDLEAYAGAEVRVLAVGACLWRPLLLILACDKFEYYSKPPIVSLHVRIN